MDVRRIGEESLIQGDASDDEPLWKPLQHLLDRMTHRHAFRVEPKILRQHDVRPIRKRVSDALERFPPHDDRLMFCRLSEIT